MTIPVPEPKIFGSARDLSYPAPMELIHVSIYHFGPGVEDLIRFYGVVLNMRLVFKYIYPTFEFIALSHDDENHRVGIVNNLVDRDRMAGTKDAPAGEPLPKDGLEPRTMPQRKCRVEHTSWLYRSFEDVLATAERIHKELGLWPRSCRHQAGGLTIDYTDPDGNRVELVSQSSSKAEILFNLEKLLGPKGGVDVRQWADTYAMFNMEKMIGLWRSGVPVEKLRNKEYCIQLINEGKL
jgi:catechol 2,3-dioxygenase-like lactoylglutathione lyase family enzyme